MQSSDFSQILLLESRIQAYAGRISLLQSRLLATLDTLDVIQTNQAHELSSAASTQASFREQLDEYKKVVEAAELERDDLRDAVSELIKKGGLGFKLCEWVLRA